MPLTKEQRAEISRANGRKSRGPKTAKGKSFSSRNALKHGLASGAALDHPGLPQAERVRTEQLEKALRPQNDLELEMVRQIASYQVLIRQIEIIEYPYLAAATTAIELGRALVRFDRYKAKAENRSRRLQFRLFQARQTKIRQNEPDFSYKKQCLTRVSASSSISACHTLRGRQLEPLPNVMTINSQIPTNSPLDLAESRDLNHITLTCGHEKPAQLAMSNSTPIATSLPKRSPKLKTVKTNLITPTWGYLGMYNRQRMVINQ